MFELLSFAIFGPMLFAILLLLLWQGGCAAFARLRAMRVPSSFFFGDLRVRLQKKTEQNSAQRIYEV